MSNYTKDCSPKEQPSIDGVLEIAQEGIATLDRIDNLLCDQFTKSEIPTDSDVYRVIVGPWLTQARQVTEASLYHLSSEIRAGKAVALDDIQSNFQRQVEGLNRLEERLRTLPPGTAASECTYESGWAGASIVFGIGACAVSLGFGCVASAVFAVKALDDATEACQ
ncbi:MAG: hypothetical protein AAGE59_19825 [Cyanobacteria bacterium P01_F01_bin.86]